MKVPYRWVWPGQPGGYEPVLGDEMARGAQAKAQFDEARAKKQERAAPTRKQRLTKARRQATRDNTGLFKGEKP